MNMGNKFDDNFEPQLSEILCPQKKNPFSLVGLY